MNIRIYGSSLSGSVRVASSKSAMQRACALALIRQGSTHILSHGTSDDDQAALAIIQALGAKVTPTSEGGLRVSSEGVCPISDEVYCGESGLSMRMFTPIIATTSRRMCIRGGGSLKTRPMDFFDQVLPALGVKVRSHQGKLPLEVEGPIRVASLTRVSGEASSQYITGLLIAFAALGARHATIEVEHLKSKPYVDLTLSMMRHFGYAVRNEQYERFVFDEQTYLPPSQREVEIAIEGDWSGAAFLLVAGALVGEVTLRGLWKDSTQADRAILEVLRQARVAYDMAEDGAINVRKSTVYPFTFDATDCPDIFPPLVALAAYALGKSSIKGVSRLAHKESNRGLTLQEEFGKLGVKVELEGDWMHVWGANSLKEGVLLSSHHDHRIAMSLAVAVLPTSSDYVIVGADAVNKSYPDFYHHLSLLGGRCEPV